jgi:type II secretory pathway pseudopilin PulG
VIEILLLSILGLAAAGYAGLWLWSRRRNRRLAAERALRVSQTWGDILRREQHERFNAEFLEALGDDREEFLRHWRGE